MTNRTIEDLAEELCQRWAALFVQKDWSERLQLLHEVHEQLQEDLGDLAMYSAVSPVLTRKLIERLGDGPVTSTAQAHIYANSDDEEHRHAAGDWLARHQGRNARA
ncbi:MAG TPA: hypothetical protein VET85_02515 [Stellaceae bacterium]|nr:hypothetical protein [Stellaceae bacterium]